MLKKTAFSSWKPPRRQQPMSKTYSTKLVSHFLHEESNFQQFNFPLNPFPLFCLFCSNRYSKKATTCTAS